MVRAVLALPPGLGRGFGDCSLFMSERDGPDPLKTDGDTTDLLGWLQLAL